MTTDKLDLLATFFLMEMLKKDKFSFTIAEFLTYLGFESFQLNAWTPDCSEEEAEEALSFLEKRGLIEAFRHRYAATRYNLVDDTGWIEQAASSGLESYKPTSRYGYSWLFEALGNIPPTDTNTLTELETTSSDLETPVPASDRYVSAQDNQPFINQLLSKTTALSAAVSENRDNDFDDKEGRLAELAALELLLSQQQVSVPLVEKILSETVAYLAKRFTDSAIGQIAVELLKLAATAIWISL